MLPLLQTQSAHLCARCLQPTLIVPPVCWYSASASQLQSSPPDQNVETSVDKQPKQPTAVGAEEGGAMSRRLRDLTDQALEGSGRGGQGAVSEAGFSDELRRELEERITSATFRHEHRSAFAEAELPTAAGRGTRDIATAAPWTGQESLHDGSLRMLNDSHKPLRTGGSRGLGPAIPLPRNINVGRAPKASAGTRLANARDQSGIYTTLKDSFISENEREQRFKELKERFSPHARAVVPGTIQGLASLANERIEDAIARGQFKNLPRGKKIERDYNASSPFLDTTEYFMNKIIQKQDIVPPWIEKQQELLSTANKFRARLRNDWKRHAARMIASKGGTLQQQMQRAEAYAKAELMANPRKKITVEPKTGSNSDHISQISPSGELKVPVEEGPATADGADGDTVPTAHPFRDPTWESTESSYLKLSINQLNSLTRSYNLQAPDLAKKPYFSLARELNACYADVAPQLAEAIRERATAPKAKIRGFGPGTDDNAGVMDRLVGAKTKVRDEKAEKRYGFKQLWNDVWGSGS